jgi:hypothetical protein
MSRIGPVFREACVWGSVWGTTSPFGTLRRPDPRHEESMFRPLGMSGVPMICFMIQYVSGSVLHSVPVWSSKGMRRCSNTWAGTVTCGSALSMRTHRIEPGTNWPRFRGRSSYSCVKCQEGDEIPSCRSSEGRWV